MSRQTVLGCGALLFCALLLSTPARADVQLQALHAKPGQIRVDGSAREWPRRGYGRLGDDEDGSVEYMLAYDDKTLYLLARIFDDKMVRSGKPGRGEDALVLTLALPTRGGRYIKTEIWLYAGVPGAQASKLTISPRTAKAGAAKIIEGPLQDGTGVLLEASIPWAALRGGENFHLARAALRLQDVDRKGGKKRNWKTASGKPSRLPELAMQGGASEALSAFRRDKGIPGATPRYDFVRDVVGDRRVERVVVVGTHVVLLGAGGQFNYRELPVVGAADVRGASMRELTGDGHRELVLTIRQRNEQGVRELLQVLSFEGGTPQMLWAIETRKETSAGFVQAEVEVAEAKGKTPAQIVARIGDSDGLNAGNYREQSAIGIEPILLPWGPVARRVYQWSSGGFSIVEEEENPDAQAPPSDSATAAVSVRTGRRREPARRAPPGTDELVAAFRQAKGIDSGVKARFSRHVNVAEDRRIESLMLFGKHLLVIGKGFRGGNGYFYFELPVAEGGDIQRLFTGDVTGDGRREIFVRFKQIIGDVQREILLGYTFREGALRTILKVEVRRARGGDAVGNVVRLVRSAKHWALRIGAGRLRGWSESNYPFVPDGGDGYGALLLPWQRPSVEYAYDGQQLRPVD